MPYQRLSPAAFSLGAPQCLLFLFNAFLFHCLHCSTGQEESQALKQRPKSGIEKFPARCQAHRENQRKEMREGKEKLNLLATFLLGFHCCCRCFLRIARGSRRRHGRGSRRRHGSGSRRRGRSCKPTADHYQPEGPAGRCR